MADDWSSLTSLLRAKLAAFSKSWHTGPEAAGAFFSKIMPGGIGFRSVQHLLGVIKPKRELQVGEEASFKSMQESRVLRASQFVRCLMDDAEIMGYKRGFSAKEVEEQLCRWFVMDWAGVAIKQVKTHLVWLSGHGRGVLAPKDGLLDLPGMLLTPAYRRWCLQRLRSSSFNPCKRYCMAETFLLGTKRGFPSEEDDLVQAAGDGYMAQMSQDLPRDRGAVLSWKGTKFMVDSLVQEAIEKTVDEVFGFTMSVDWERYTPSQRAGYKAPILKGGILGELLRSGIAATEEILVAMLENHTGVYEVRGHEVDTASVYRHALEKWGRISNEQADCQVYFIREPLKLRTITAGTPDLYGALQPMLAHLRRGMKRFDCFQLTRDICDWQVVERRMNRDPLGARRLGAVAWDWFISGDFQQSTNDLAMWATSIAVDSAFGGQAWNMANRALGRQRIWLDKERVFVQNRGQLMGSPLSFPFLCVINAALARLAFEIVHPELEGLDLDTFPIMINGDDFLARASEDVYFVWQKIISHVGWKLSPGKSYFLQRLVQINSQTREVMRMVKRQPEANYEVKENYLENWADVAKFGVELSPWAERRLGHNSCVVHYKFGEPIPFINGGYLQQLKKATAQIDCPSVDTMSLDWRERYESLARLPYDWCWRARRIMCRNLERLCAELYQKGRTPFRLSLHNPVGLGGLGIPKYSERLVGSQLAYVADTTLDVDQAWNGLHACNVRPETVRLRAWNTKEPGDIQAREPSPLLEWRNRAPRLRRPCELLEAMVEDLDRYLTLLQQPKLPVIAGVLDTSLKLCPPQGASAGRGCTSSG